MEAGQLVFNATKEVHIVRGPSTKIANTFEVGSSRCFATAVNPEYTPESKETVSGRPGKAREDLGYLFRSALLCFFRNCSTDSLFPTPPMPDKTQTTCSPLDCGRKKHLSSIAETSAYPA